MSMVGHSAHLLNPGRILPWLLSRLFRRRTAVRLGSPPLGRRAFDDGEQFVCQKEDLGADGQHGLRGRVPAQPEWAGAAIRTILRFSPRRNARSVPERTLTQPSPDERSNATRGNVLPGRLDRTLCLVEPTLGLGLRGSGVDSRQNRVVTSIGDPHEFDPQPRFHLIRCGGRRCALEWRRDTPGGPPGATSDEEHRRRIAGYRCWCRHAHAPGCASPRKARRGPRGKPRPDKRRGGIRADRTVPSFRTDLTERLQQPHVNNRSKSRARQRAFSAASSPTRLLPKKASSRRDIEGPSLEIAHGPIDNRLLRPHSPG